MNALINDNQYYPQPYQRPTYRMPPTPLPSVPNRDILYKEDDEQVVKLLKDIKKTMGEMNKELKEINKQLKKM